MHAHAIEPNPAVNRPAADECAPFYADYIARVPDGDVSEFLAKQLASLSVLLAAASEELAEHRYAPGKWSVKEVVAHITDAERVLAYRLLRFARGDETELAGYDENRYVAASSAGRRTLAALLDELRAVRAATLTLIGGLEPAAWQRAGVANGARVSVRALAWIIAGHAQHHEHLLRTRYL
jgi:hypothetical protein